MIILQGMDYIGLGGRRLVFLYNKKGEVDRLAIPLEPAVDDIIFTRAPAPKPAAPPAQPPAQPTAGAPPRPRPAPPPPVSIVWMNEG